MVAILKRKIKVIAVTIADDKDINELKKELKSKGKLIGYIFTDPNGKKKGGAFLWKWKKISKDVVYLIIVMNTSSLKEAVTGQGLKSLSTRGLFDLKSFHKNYPDIPIHDIGTVVEGSEIPLAVEKFEKAKSNINSDDWIKLNNEIENITESQTGFKTRELNIGCMVTINDDHFNRFLKEIKDHTAIKNNRIELWGGRWEDEDIGIALWHWDKVGKDEYWIFLILDKDTLLEGKIDWKAPNIEKFSEDYPSIPITKISAINPKAEIQLQPSAVIKEFKKRRLDAMKAKKKKK